MERHACAYGITMLIKLLPPGLSSNERHNGVISLFDYLFREMAGRGEKRVQLDHQHSNNQSSEQLLICKAEGTG